jgi:hypothetical protein
LVLDGDGHHHGFVGGLSVCGHPSALELGQSDRWRIPYLFAATLSFAPFRSWFDPNYLGLGLGFLRFEGQAATLPCALMLAWALAAALLAVAKGGGRWMILVLAGDAFWALNFAGSLLLESAEKSKVQLGETATFTGAWALLILLSFSSSLSS